MNFDDTKPIRLPFIVGGVAIAVLIAWLVFLVVFSGADLERILSQENGLLELTLMPIVLVVLAAALIVFPVGWFQTLRWGIKTYFQLRPDIPHWQRFWIGQILMFSPRYLTPLGIEYRGKLLHGLQWLSIGAILILLAFILGYPVGLVSTS